MDEAAYNLLDVLLFGGASFVHSDNGREFCNNILQCVTQLSKGKMIKGKPRHSQS